MLLLVVILLCGMHGCEEDFPRKFPCCFVIHYHDDDFASLPCGSHGVILIALSISIVSSYAKMLLSFLSILTHSLTFRTHFLE